jgi:hypothetical protein
MEQMPGSVRQTPAHVRQIGAEALVAEHEWLFEQIILRDAETLSPATLDIGAGTSNDFASAAAFCWSIPRNTGLGAPSTSAAASPGLIPFALIKELMSSVLFVPALLNTTSNPTSARTCWLWQ